MKKCKWSGDKNDNYCVSCDGIEMMVDGVATSCTKCAGYEEGDEEVRESSKEEVMNKPEEVEEVPVATKIDKKPSTTKKETKSTKSSTKKEKSDTSENEASKEDVKEEAPIVVENIKEEVEELDGIVVVSLKYTSGITVKKNDDFYKFVAEEQWDVSNYKGDIQDARDLLWEKLNEGIDSQIEAIS